MPRNPLGQLRIYRDCVKTLSDATDWSLDIPDRAQSGTIDHSEELQVGKRDSSPLATVAYQLLLVRGVDRDRFMFIRTSLPSGDESAFPTCNLFKLSSATHPVAPGSGAENTRR